MARRRHRRAHPRCPARQGPDGRRQECRTDRRADRLPVRPHRRHRPGRNQGLRRGQKVKGRKRFIVTDTLGLLLAVDVVAANVQDRDGARRPLLRTRLDHPSVQKIRADQGFAGRLVDWTAQILGETMVRWAMIGVMARRLARGRAAARSGPRLLAGSAQVS
ncbi:transposase [Kitasatospora sp. NPDC059577]|uniref:transposase n=1 Tax=Kitasatospora sp. NPDC059577 TaxID=3346873 RepID=UPI0036A6E2A2